MTKAKILSSCEASFRRHKWDEIITRCTDYNSTNPNDPDIILMLSNAYRKKKDKDLAIHYAQKASELSNDASRYKGNYAFTLYDFGIKDCSTHIATEVLEAKRHNIDDLLGKELAAWTLEDYTESLRCNMEVLSEKKTAEIYFNIGCCYHAIKNYREAIKAYELALKSDEEYADAWANKGMCAYRLEEFDDALAYYSKATTIDNNFSDAWNVTGVTHYRKGNLDQALRCYCKAIRSDKSNDKAYFNKGIALELKGKFLAAWRNYDKAHSIKPNKTEYVEARYSVKSKALKSCNKPINKGYILYKHDLHRRALKIFEKIKKPTLATLAQYYIGMCQIKLTCFDEALKTLTTLIQNTTDPRLKTKTLIARSIAHKALAKYKEALNDLESINDEFTDKKSNKQISKIKNEITNAQEMHKKISKLRTKKNIDTESLIQLVQSKKEHANLILTAIRQRDRSNDEFLIWEPSALPEKSFFLVLKRWNSFTPTLPSNKRPPRKNIDPSVGGGYYLHHKGFGVVIDPGFNFIENFSNAGLNFSDINAVVITHAHNDHTADLETLLTMAYKANRKNNKRTIDLYLNIGSYKKFSTIIDLFANSVNIIQTIHAGDKITLIKNSLTMTVLPSYHHEILSRRHAVGIHFTISTTNTTNSQIENKNIVITSDTGLYPTHISDDQKDLNIDTNSSKEIWKTYSIKDKIDLLITHLGSIKTHELEEKTIQRCLYENHLGLIGTIRLLTSLDYKLALISEFGEEFTRSRTSVVRFIKSCLTELCISHGNILPADIGFEYDISTNKIFVLDDIEDDEENYCGELAHSDDCHCAEECNVRYINRKRPLQGSVTEEIFSTWKSTRKSGEAWYLKPISKKTPQLPTVL